MLLTVGNGLSSRKTFSAEKSQRNYAQFSEDPPWFQKKKNACYTGFEPATHGTGFRMDALQAMVFEQVARLVQLKQNVTVLSILASV